MSDQDRVWASWLSAGWTREAPTVSGCYPAAFQDGRAMVVAVPEGGPAADFAQRVAWWWCAPMPELPDPPGQPETGEWVRPPAALQGVGDLLRSLTCRHQRHNNHLIPTCLDCGARLCSRCRGDGIHHKDTMGQKRCPSVFKEPNHFGPGESSVQCELGPDHEGAHRWGSVAWSDGGTRFVPEAPPPASEVHGDVVDPGKMTPVQRQLALDWWKEASMRMGFPVHRPYDMVTAAFDVLARAMWLREHGCGLLQHEPIFDELAKAFGWVRDLDDKVRVWRPPAGLERSALEAAERAAAMAVAERQPTLAEKAMQNPAIARAVVRSPLDLKLDPEAVPKLLAIGERAGIFRRAEPGTVLGILKAAESDPPRCGLLACREPADGGRLVVVACVRGLYHTGPCMGPKRLAAAGGDKRTLPAAECPRCGEGERGPKGEWLDDVGGQCPLCGYPENHGPGFARWESQGHELRMYGRGGGLTPGVAVLVVKGPDAGAVDQVRRLTYAGEDTDPPGVYLAAGTMGEAWAPTSRARSWTGAYSPDQLEVLPEATLRRWRGEVCPARNPVTDRRCELWVDHEGDHVHEEKRPGDFGHGVWPQ